tara:strand:- start:2479 stop:2910 length:432 start_codon:yes stop_codon:yes gene_type:complete
MSNYTEQLIAKFKSDYKLTSADFWDLKRGNKTTWIIKHTALEKIAAQSEITWTLDVLNFSPDVVVKCVAKLNDKTIESLGESSKQNTMNSYPYAMAEKRAVDRCILKLLNAHAHLYSEAEADAFEEPVGNKKVKLLEDKINGK